MKVTITVPNTVRTIAMTDSDGVVYTFDVAATDLVLVATEGHDILGISEGSASFYPDGMTVLCGDGSCCCDTNPGECPVHEDDEPVLDRVLVVGNPIDGCRIIGPFAEGDDVDELIEQKYSNETWWIADLTSVADATRED